MKLSEKLEKRRKHYHSTLPLLDASYVNMALAEAVSIAIEHEQLQGRRATETWRNPGWEEREKESK